MCKNCCRDISSFLGNRNTALSHYDMVMISESDKLDHLLKMYFYAEKLYIFACKICLNDIYESINDFKYRWTCKKYLQCLS